MDDTVRLSLTEVHDLARAVCLAHGCSRAQAEAIAATVTAAERDACASHGLFRIPFYVDVIAGGTVAPAAEPGIADLAPGVIGVDGGLGFAPLALQVGAAPLAERARCLGVAALCVTRVVHVAALWPEVERLAEQGLVAFAFTAAIDYVAPAGGTRPLFGTNPMAFGWPRAGQPPLVWDQASSASARGEIQLCLRDGKPIPEGWAIGPDGQPTTDPATALAGAQLPFGGHKGSSIALMVELLAGALVGDLFSFEARAADRADTGAPQGGEFMLAIDPARCVRDGDRAAQLARGELLFDRLLDQEGTRLPGQRRLAARERTAREGITIPARLHATLQALRAGPGT
ncbi:MAG: Ldh family oxidoreductase [Gammaproteobacteria bacterium]|nr:Ldh family oxidoreductase [Gammaproteobacteria bacterium]